MNKLPFFYKNRFHDTAHQRGNITHRLCTQYERSFCFYGGIHLALHSLTHLQIYGADLLGSQRDMIKIYFFMLLVCMSLRTGLFRKESESSPGYRRNSDNQNDSFHVCLFFYFIILHYNFTQRILSEIRWQKYTKNLATQLHSNLQTDFCN